MFKIKKIIVVGLSTIIVGTIAEASMMDQLIYNVAGQATNAAGARIGDEIYYGSSKGTRSTRKHRRKHRSKKRAHKRKVIAPVVKLTDEKKIQKALSSLGFYKGKIDGQINSFETRSAIKKMNIEYAISNNASLKPEAKDTLIYLGTLFGFDRTLIASGNDEKTKARKIQTALKIHGYYHDKIDGAIGSGTRSCISNYKNENGMSPSGALDFEEEYKLISSAKEKNDKNMETSIASLESLGHNVAQQTILPKNQTVTPPSAQSQNPTIAPVIQQPTQVVSATQQQTQKIAPSNNVQQITPTIQPAQVVPATQQAQKIAQ